jgi:hypothetical protein
MLITTEMLIATETMTELPGGPREHGATQAGCDAPLSSASQTAARDQTTMIGTVRFRH